MKYIIFLIEFCTSELTTCIWFVANFHRKVGYTSSWTYWFVSFAVILIPITDSIGGAFAVGYFYPVERHPCRGQKWLHPHPFTSSLVSCPCHWSAYSWISRSTPERTARPFPGQRQREGCPIEHWMTDAQDNAWVDHMTNSFGGLLFRVSFTS